MEALASGTPVIAFASGALPEIVDHGRTGFIVSGMDEMAEALRNIHLIKPATCRRVARARFSAETMGARYLALYRDLTGEPAGRVSLQAATV